MTSVTKAETHLNIKVDPLLVAIFDLPSTIPSCCRKQTKKGNPLTIIKSAGPVTIRNTSSGKTKTAPLRLKLTGADDDGVASDNTSILQGETISLTDDQDFFDAAADFNPRISLPSFHSSQMTNFSVFRNEYSKETPNTLTNLEVEQNGSMQNDDADISVSSKKKKKKKRSAFKKFKKFVDSKLPLRSHLYGPSMAVASTAEEEDSIHSSTTRSDTDSKKDYMSIYVENINDRLPALQSKVASIRSEILSLECDLIVTRNGLDRAYQHLHSANLELEELQRTVVKVDTGLSIITQQYGRVSLEDISCYSLPESESNYKSHRSSSSDRLHFFTPTSSVIDGDDSDRYFSGCDTPHSMASLESFSTVNKDILQPTLNEIHQRELTNDDDATPVKRNSISEKCSLIKVEPVLFPSSFGKESVSMDTPSTVASTQDTSQTTEISTSQSNDASDVIDGDKRDRKVTFFKQPSFIRTHDLCCVNGADNTPLICLHTNDLSPIITALFQKGLQAAVDESDRWTPVWDTKKILSKRSNMKSEDVDGPMGSWPNAASGRDILVWSAPCPHDGHGSEYPMVKARGIIPSPALKVVHLLLDSDRVKHYNKMSLGRIDEHYFSAGVDNPDECPHTGIMGETKIVRSNSQPPIIRKPVELRALLHARRLHAEGDETAKYITISRSVWETAEGTVEESDGSSTRIEMFLSVNLIRDLNCSSDKKWCEITTVTHAASPAGIPLAIGKRVGLGAIGNYIRDLRAVFEK